LLLLEEGERCESGLVFGVVDLREFPAATKGLGSEKVVKNMTGGPRHSDFRSRTRPMLLLLLVLLSECKRSGTWAL
jgi:hypothetical protein